VTSPEIETAAEPLLRPLHPGVGAELRGVYLRNTAEDAVRRVRDALLSHLLVVIRDQKLEPADFAAVAGRFGEAETFADKGHPDCPEVMTVSNRPGKGDETPPYWHSDGMLQPEPPMLTLFYAVEVPKVGGDTLFLNAQAAFEALPEAERRRLGSLRGVQTNGVEHPIVRAHPITGRKALYVDLGLTVGVAGIPRDDAISLFRRLKHHCDRPEQIYRHRFRPGDLVIWDNAATAHSATETPPGGGARLMLRATVRGGPTS
jgi:taurine dioxygenase